jgi:hypothetical protein
MRDAITLTLIVRITKFMIQRALPGLNKEAITKRMQEAIQRMKFAYPNGYQGVPDLPNYPATRGKAGPAFDNALIELVLRCEWANDFSIIAAMITDKDKGISKWAPTPGSNTNPLGDLIDTENKEEE